MALIGKIRNNSWLLVVMIGLGLGGFVLMDMMSGQQSIFGSGQTIMAEINGNKLDINEFTNTENILYRNSQGDPYGRRANLWNYYIESYIVREEAGKIGLGVSKEELLDLQFGNNLSPVITSRFQTATGQVDRNQLNQFKSAIENNSLDPSVRPFWAHQENEVVKERLKEKLTNLAVKGTYVPNWMAEMMSNDQNQKMDLLYVQLPFSQIGDAEVALTDADYQAYLDENMGRYIQDEEVRKLSYVIFDVIASAADSAAIKNEISELLDDFVTTENDSLFVDANFGSMDGTYQKKDAVNADIADTVFQMAAGEVFGPYIDNQAYKAVKVVDRKVLPDSVRSRHILIRADPQNYPQVQQAFTTIDSLKNLLEAGTHSFDSLALQFGQDGTAANGGDVGYAALGGQMARNYHDLIFFRAEPGKLYVIGTEFGVHLVEVTGQKFLTNEEGVKLAFISQAIVPSEETQRSVEESALNFSEAHSSLDAIVQAVADRDDLSVETTGPLQQNAYSIIGLGSSQASRDMIRWAFGDDPATDAPSIGGVSPELYRFQDPVEFYNNKYVITALKSIQKAGKPKVADVKDDIEQAVISQKKGAMLVSQLEGEQNLQAAASKYGVTVDTAQNVTFSTGFLANVGAEPKVVATAFNLEVNQVSKPVIGNSGVFMVMPTYKPALAGTANTLQIRRTSTSSLQSQIRAGLMNALRKNASIEDNRARFY